MLAHARDVFIFDISGAVQEVVCDRSDRAAMPRRSAPEPELPPKVIRQWLAGVAIALLGLGVSAEPGADRERPAAFAVVQAW